MSAADEEAAALHTAFVNAVRNCHLQDLRRLLEHHSVLIAKKDERVPNWLDLLEQLPERPPPGGAEPAALARALLGAPGVKEQALPIMFGEVGWGIENKVRLGQLCTELATIRQGSRLYIIKAQCTKQWWGRFDKRYVGAKALNKVGLSDAKRLCPEKFFDTANSRHVDLALGRAFANCDDSVFNYALRFKLRRGGNSRARENVFSALKWSLDRWGPLNLEVAGRRCAAVLRAGQPYGGPGLDETAVALLCRTAGFGPYDPRAASQLDWFTCIVFKKEGSHFPLRAQPGGGVITYLALLLGDTSAAYGGKRFVRTLRGRAIRGDWWNALTDEMLQSEHVKTLCGVTRNSGVSAFFACVNPACDGLIGSLELLLDARRLSAEPEEIQYRAVTLLAKIAAWMLTEHSNERAGELCQGCGYARHETSHLVAAWLRRLHAAWPKLDCAEIYQVYFRQGVQTYRLDPSSSDSLGVFWHHFAAAGRPLLQTILKRMTGVSRTEHRLVGDDTTYELRLQRLRFKVKLLQIDSAMTRLKRRFFREKWRTRARVIGTELALVPPSPVLTRGGAMFQQAEIDFAVRSFRPHEPPVHATPESLAWYAAHPAAISVKADGRTVDGRPPAGVYPPFPAELSAQAELVELAGGREVWLVFDIAGPGLADAPLVDAMEALRCRHPHCPEWSAAADGHVADGNALIKFLTATDARSVWWPKWCVVAPSGTDLLALVDTQPTAVAYPNDGWVLTPLVPRTELSRGRCPRILKVKPAHEVTADVLWTGTMWQPLVADVKTPDGPPADAGVVWRCSWADGAWRPREPRPEKRYPNPPDLVKWLTDFHRSPWRPAELERYVNARHYASGPRRGLSAATAAFLRQQRVRAADWLAETGLAGCRSVLDVGCGRGGQRMAGPKKWTGIDFDPVSVAEARLRHPTDAWLWCDAADSAHPLTGRPHPQLAAGSFDGILAIHSIQNSARSVSEWTAWRDTVTRLAAPGALLCIIMQDASAMRAQFVLPDNSWARPLGPAPNAPEGALQVRTSLAWAASANEPATEVFITAGALVDHYAAAGWNLLAMEESLPALPAADAHSGWNAWRAAERRMVLQLRK